VRENDPLGTVLPLPLRDVPGLIPLLLLAACRAVDPWGPALALPDHPDDDRWSVLLLDGQPAGLEQRVTAGHTVVRRRTWSFVLDGKVATVRAGSRTQSDGEQAIRWTDGTRTWAGEAYVLDLFPPPATGTWPVLDPGTGEVEDEVVTVDGGVVTGMLGRAEFDGPHLVRATLGRFALVPGAPDTKVTPIDPAELLSVPVGSDHPAHPVVATFRVGGEEIVVQAPLPEELPSEQVGLWRELVREVGTDGDCDARTERFVRLAAARGVEARAVAGLALDRAHDRLAPHAWAEVHAGDRWVAVDPTFGDAPADAARLAFGESSRPRVVARMLGGGPPVELISLR
jgi:hypothetical protein